MNFKLTIVLILVVAEEYIRVHAAKDAEAAWDESVVIYKKFVSIRAHSPHLHDCIGVVTSQETVVTSTACLDFKMVAPAKRKPIVCSNSARHLEKSGRMSGIRVYAMVFTRHSKNATGLDYLKYTERRTGVLFSVSHHSSPRWVRKPLKWDTAVTVWTDAEFTPTSVEIVEQKILGSDDEGKECSIYYMVHPTFHNHSNLGITYGVYIPHEICKGKYKLDPNIPSYYFCMEEYYPFTTDISKVVMCDSHLIGVVVKNVPLAETNKTRIFLYADTLSSSEKLAMDGFCIMYLAAMLNLIVFRQFSCI